MLCLNCQSDKNVSNGLCLQCKVVGIDIEQFRSSRNRRSKTYNIYNPKLIQTLILLSVLAILTNKYDFLPIFWNRTTKAGILAPKIPVQTSADIKPWTHNGYLFKALYNYQIEARILLKANYWLSSGADISPIDLTLGWGPMSDQSILNKIRLSSGIRYYYWSSSSEPPIASDEINRHAANVHMIPKNKYILSSLQKFSVGDIVRLNGYLVEISKADGYSWTSSTTREDSGDGACEVMWVDSVEKLS